MCAYSDWTSDYPLIQKNPALKRAGTQLPLGALEKVGQTKLPNLGFKPLLFETIGLVGTGQMNHAYKSASGYFFPLTSYHKETLYLDDEVPED